jgi:purine-binding chemotaxis protein CheW
MEPGSAVETEAGLEAAAAPEWLVVTCGGRAFALELARIRAILPVPAFTRVPGCGAHVCGIAGLRGQVVTAFDLGVLLGERASRLAADARLLLVDRGERTVGLVVDAVRMAAALCLEAGAVPGLDEAAVLGTGRLDGEAVAGIDAAGIIDRLLA